MFEQYPDILTVEEVCEALRKAGLTVTAVKEKEDWRCVTAKK